PGQHSLQGGQSVSGSLNNQQSTSSPTPTSSSAQATKKTLEDVLIKLITNTIRPETWDSMGGPGTIDYFPLGMALTINQTPDIQEQIQELLHPSGACKTWKWPSKSASSRSPRRSSS